MKDPINSTDQVSPFPKLNSNKESMVLSGTGTLRRRDPTNRQTASHNVNMVFDHSVQSPLWPDGNPNALIESTHATGTDRNYRTMNRSGRPYALGVHVGGSPDDYLATPVLDERSQLKILK
jgi:hypothetical protein